LLFQFDAGQHGDKIDGIVVASNGLATIRHHNAWKLIAPMFSDWFKKLLSFVVFVDAGR
jgi:hypothetical protein